MGRHGEHREEVEIKIHYVYNFSQRFQRKHKITASSPISSWQIDEEKMETMTDFIFLGSKITVDGDCSYEIERHLLLGRKAMTNLEVY